MTNHNQLRRLTTAALFAAAITITTAYLLHIPLPVGGYVHVGDSLIYLAACLLPTPWAMLTGAIGGGLADLLTAPIWALPTLLIKALLCLPFTSKNPHILCARNGIAVVISGLLSPLLYGLVNVFYAGGAAAFLPQFLGTLVQSVASGILFLLFAFAMDRIGLKQRLSTH